MTFAAKLTLKFSNMLYAQQFINKCQYGFSGHVKLNLTTSDVAVLEGATSEPDVRSKSSTSLAVM